MKSVGGYQIEGLGFSSFLQSPVTTSRSLGFRFCRLLDYLRSESELLA
jgi:hypothetical protein